VERIGSLGRSKFAAAFAGLACVALLAGVLGADAQGKKKKPKGSRVTNTSQAAILERGSLIVIPNGTGKIVIHAIADGKSLGKVASVAARGRGGKKKGARSAKASVAKLSEQGKALLGGCAVEGLRTSQKGHRRVVTPLDRDLGICSVPSENPTAKPYKGPPIDTANSGRCDFLDPAVCLQPWPNDYFTVADPGTDTGRRLNLATASMPANKAGIAIDPTDINRGDGFSPGNLITVKVPEVSTQTAFQNSGFVPINDIRRYDDDNQPAIVIDVETGERHPIWSELDANAASSADANVIIRPARNFEEGHRYIVALRGLRDAQNQPVDPPMPFRVYRDRLITQQAPVESRRAHVEQLISTLKGAGFARSNLYMAWDFTVASEQSLTDRALEIRDDAFAELGDTDLSNGTVEGASPSFTVTGVLSQGDPVPPGDSALPTGALRRVDGMITDAPCYLNVDGCAPGATFDFDSGGDLQFNPAFTTDIPFRCFIPESVVQAGSLAPAKMATFGHGLLGDLAQVSGQVRLANLHNSVWCATNWAGFSSDDYPNVLNSLGNLSNFNKLVDRMQQGFVNFMLLGRALVHDDGFRDDEAFEIDPDGDGGDPAGSILESTNDLYFEGISQGGIMGGALTALSPDFTRSILNVPAINYSTLLRRSVDFDEYAHGVFFDTDTDLGLYDNYPDEVERPLILSLMQLLWDRGEGNGYAHHMTTDPLPNTPEHQVLLQAALGDHQVANIGAEVEARTIGASIYKPALDPGRHWEANPFMQLPAINFGSAPFTEFEGSALVYYDGGPTSYFNDGVGEAVIECTNNPLSTVPLSNTCQGSGTPPNTEVPPRPQTGHGEDPHGYPRRSVDGLGHIVQFLEPDGSITPCVDPGPVIRPCYANGWTGP
jgi:hypothetical protein